MPGAMGSRAQLYRGFSNPSCWVRMHRVAEADGAVEKRRAHKGNGNNIDSRCLKHGITAPSCTRSVSGSSGTTRPSEKKERKERKECMS